jgi:hypothetical protein
MSGDGRVETANVVRQELRLFLSTADLMGLDGDRQRRFLRLSQDEWQRLLGVLRDEPVPSHPALPLLLRHLGYLSSRLDRAAHAGCA